MPFNLSFSWLKRAILSSTSLQSSCLTYGLRALFLVNSLIRASDGYSRSSGVNPRFFNARDVIVSPGKKMSFLGDRGGDANILEFLVVFRRGDLLRSFGCGVNDDVLPDLFVFDDVDNVD